MVVDHKVIVLYRGIVPMTCDELFKAIEGNKNASVTVGVMWSVDTCWSIVRAPHPCNSSAK